MTYKRRRAQAIRNIRRNGGLSAADYEAILEYSRAASAAKCPKCGSSNCSLGRFSSTQTGPEFPAIECGDCEQITPVEPPFASVPDPVCKLEEYGK